MLLSQIELREGAGRRLAYGEAVFNEYGFHRLVWRLFGDSAERKRDFLYRLEDDPSRFSILTLSAREPVDSDGLFHIQTKKFAPQLSVGDRLQFKLRANPTIARKREGKRSARHDVVMDAKRMAREQGFNVSSTELIQTEGLAWLRGERARLHGKTSREERLGYVFDPESIRVDGYRQHRLRPGKGRPEIRHSTLDFEGELTVRDPNRFVDAVVQGIGPEKAFGCGLMLLRRS